MTRRTVSIFVRSLAGLVAGLAVLAGFGLWLLSRGPVSLDAIAPLVADMLSRGNGLAVTIDHTLLTLAPGGRLEILARGVHFRREGGGATLNLADLGLEFRFRTLLDGAIAPTRIIVTRPELRLVRDPDGSFHLGVGDLTSGASEDWGAKLVGDLVRPPAGRGTLGFLTELEVRNASLVVDDRSLGVEWHAQDANASLIRAKDRTRGDFRLTVGQGPAPATLSGDFTFLPSYDWLVVRVGFNGLTPARWSAAAPSLADLAALDLPVSGDVIAELDPAKLTLRDAIWDLRFGRGELRDAFFPGGALSIAGATFKAGYDPVKGRINLGQLSVDFGPGTASASGTVNGLGADLLAGKKPPALGLSLALAAQGITLNDLSRFWPARVAADARDWVTQHVRDGTVDTLKAQLDMDMNLASAAASRAKVEKFDGTMKYSGVAVEYFRPLPPVTKIDGTAQFDRTAIEFKANSGTAGNIRVSSATARLYQLDTHDQKAKVQVALQGPVRDALTLLDHPPLGYAKDVGLDPKRAQGNVSARLDFAFPLLRDLKLKDVDYGAEARLTGLALNDVMFRRDLTDGDLNLKLTRTAVQADGTAKLAGVPVALTWRENLAPGAKVRTHYAVKARLDGAQRAALGLDFFKGALGGTVAVDADYDIAADKKGQAEATLDLKDATLDVAQLGWKKPAGVPAAAHVALDLSGDEVTAIRDATLTGGGMDAKGAVAFDAGGALRSVTLDHVVAPGDDFHGSLARAAGGGWRVTLAGKSFDASALIPELERSIQGPTPPLDIDIRLDNLRLGPNRQAQAVSAALVSDGPHWQRAAIDARLSSKGTASLVYGGAAGDRNFKFVTDDFGALIRDLGIYGDIEGGTFQLAGRAEDRNGTRVLVTKAEGGDYRVVRAPTLAQLLSLASLSGIGGMLTGQGIPFSRIEGDVTFSSGKIALENMRAYGGAIGINASGTVDRTAGQMNVSGTLVPAYTLNTVLGDIPLIGKLLVGGEGQGIFAANFRVYGSIDNPRISVNPLSTLAPGVLRNLFLFSPAGPSR